MRRLLIALAALGASGPAHGQAADVADDKGWEVSVAPYVWATGLEGEVGVFPGLPPVDVDVSFGDVFDHLDFAGMVLLQARKGRFVSMVDLSYVKLSADRGLEIDDLPPIDAELETSLFIGTGLAGYRAMDRGDQFLDLFAGIRVSAVETELSVAVLQQSFAAQEDRTWVDPVIGAKFRTLLANKWSLMTYGDIGGFGVSSDLTWQLQAILQYQINDRWSVGAGWRQYAIDYDKRDFEYDVSMGGPIFGAAYRF